MDSTNLMLSFLFGMVGLGLLMYGKRPSFAELARWIKYAG